MWWDVGIKFISNSKTWVVEPLSLPFVSSLKWSAIWCLGAIVIRRFVANQLQSAQECCYWWQLAFQERPWTIAVELFTGEGKGSVWICFHLGCWEKSELVDIGRLRISTCLRWFESFIWSSLWPPQETWWTRRNPSRKRCQMPELSGSISGIKYDQNRYFAQKAPQLVAGQFVWNLSCLIFLILVFLSW